MREIKRREENEVEFSRIVAFSDGVFAIAITLLVLALNLPSGLKDNQLWSALWDLRETFLAFAISFWVIARFWLVHHRFFGEVVGFDSRLIWLNMLYLGLIVLVPFSSEVLGEYGGHLQSVVVYAGNLAAVVIVGWWMTADARAGGLASTDEKTHREGRIRAIWIAGVFLFSILVALVDAGKAPYIWLLLFFDPSSRIVNREER
jgi:uncharacterized membrane protein